MTFVVKQSNGDTRPFDPEKLYRSLYRAGLSSNATPGEAQMQAQRAVFDTESWLQGQKEATASDIHRKAGENLKTYNRHAATMYESQSQPTRTNPFDRPATKPSESSPNRPSWLDLGKNGNWDNEQKW